ncbi:MAG: tetratricopeptide repeat protein [Gammaproteobacteria bacterium]|nr:tetratricopeptide repeat protein [Gammaproteobacteria bacterium]
MFITSLIPGVGAVANDLDDAVEAMRTGDFAVAYCILRPLAEAGDADAQYNIGWMYLNGYGLRVNDSLALEWWQKASAQGNADASFSLGMLYSLGEGAVPKDPDKAIDYYLLSAIAGQEDAIISLHSMMLRNDKAMRDRMHAILAEHASLFGIKRQVKANRLNARKGPSVEMEIMARLLKGQIVLEMFKQGKWSQVAVLGSDVVAQDGVKQDSLEQTVWIYNPLLEDVDDTTPESETHN